MLEVAGWMFWLFVGFVFLAFCWAVMRSRRCFVQACQTIANRRAT
jgi:hypothetical protein